MTDETLPEDQNETKRDANVCMALGAGVGVLGVTTALLSGAACPLCVVVAPGLVGYGAYKRWKCGSKNDSSSDIT